MAVVQKKTFCRVCGSGCGIIVDVDGDRVLRVLGDEDHPLTKGYTCSKGRALPHLHHHPDRLEVPLLRKGGALRPTSWSHLLDDLAAKLQRIIAESGPRAVGIFTGGGGYSDGSAYLATRVFPRVLKTPSVYSDMTIDVICKLIVSEMMAGAAGLTGKPDDRCKLLLFVGTNPLVSHGHTTMLNSPTVRMRELTSRGEVWVLDPRRTETAQLATRHLASRAFTDYAILGFLIRELLQDGADYDYLEQHAQDVEKLSKVVERFTLDRASAISGIGEGDLNDLLAAVRRAGRLCVETGTGISMNPAANVTQWFAWALMIVTGSLDREGGSWFTPGFLGQRDRLEFPPPAPVTGRAEPGPESRPELRGVGGEYPCAAMCDEIEAGHLRALVNFGGNLAACMPETDRTVASLEKLDVLASIDVCATETTAISTHVLPSTDQLERADLPYGMEALYPSVSTQYTEPVVAPVGECRSVWWMVAQLGKRMGLTFFPDIDPDTGTDEDALRLIASKARWDLEKIKSHTVAVAETKVIGWVQRYVDEKVGGWRLAPPRLVEQLEEMEEPAPLVLISRRQRHHANSRLLELRDRPSILVNPADAEAAGLQDGARVEVRSAHGSLQGVMRIDPTLRRGVMSVPHGWSGPYDAYNVNRLTHSRDVDPLSGMPRFSGLAVSLHPL